MRLAPCLVAGVLAWVAAGAASAQPVTFEVISSRPELVTGDSVLVRVAGAPAAPSVSANDAAPGASLSADGNGGWIGIVAGLRDGTNRLVARWAGGEAALTLISLPVNGPLFAGPRATPYRCENEAQRLAPAADAGCSAPVVTEYYYRSASGRWVPTTPSAPRPADVVEATTSDGRKAPLIVRVDRGVANRAAYVIAMLDDPARPFQSPSDRGASGWNGRLVYAFGGGASYDGHGMGTALGFLDPQAGYVGGDNVGFYERLIGDGFAIAAASLNVTGATADDVVQAETVARVKEAFVKRYGLPDFTIGVGKDGGALPLYLIGQNYPGLLDGIFAIGGYADAIQFQTAANDCALLAHYFATTRLAWSDAQKRDAAGEATLCDTYPRSGPQACAPGVACSLEENAVNVFGRDAAGRARAPWDNAGVQYGLKPFRSGLISEEQFVDLNAAIGGLAPAGGFQSVRNVGDPIAIRAAYATGRVLTGADGLTTSAIVNVRLYPAGTCGDPPCPREDADVAVAEGDRSDAVRTRMEFAALSPGNYAEVVISDDRAARGVNGFTSQVLYTALAYLDQWLTEVEAHPDSGTRPERVITYRPPALRDICISRGSAISDPRKCDQLFPAAIGVRGAADGPPSDDVIKCQLKPVDAADYSLLSTPELPARMGTIFPDGVCNYSLAGVEQVPLAGLWLTYGADGTIAPSRPR